MAAIGTIIGFLEVIIMFCQRFGWIYALKKKCKRKNFSPIYFFYTDLIDSIQKLKHNNWFQIHIVNWDLALLYTDSRKSIMVFPVAKLQTLLFVGLSILHQDALNILVTN